MLKAGVPLVDALDSVHSDKTNSLLKRTIDRVIDDVSNGMSLSKAMSKHPKIFNSMFVNIKAGESAGVLDRFLFQLADFIAHDLKLRMELHKQFVIHLSLLVLQ